MHVPVRLGAAEQTLIDQLGTAGAKAAAERLAASGLPTRKIESYHYTDLKMLLRAVPALAGAEKAVSDLAFRIPGAHRIPVTVSVGVAMLGAESAESTDSAMLLQRADEALYRAKDKGRNRVEEAIAAA